MTVSAVREFVGGAARFRTLLEEGLEQEDAFPGEAHAAALLGGATRRRAFRRGAFRVREFFVVGHVSFMSFLSFFSFPSFGRPRQTMPGALMKLIQRIS